MKHSKGFKFTVGLLVLSLGTAANAANNNWTNSAGGLWEDPTSWSQGSVPDAPDLVQVGVSGTYTVTLGSSALNAFPTTLTNNGINVYSFGSGTPTLNINFTNAATLIHTGIFNIGNGIVNVNTPNGGVQPDSYLHSLSMGSAAFGLTGTLNIQAGTVNGFQPFLGASAGSLSTVNVYTGGTFIVGVSESRLGYLGTANINVQGGTFNWNNQADLGDNAGATGRVTVSSGSFIMGLNSEMDIGSYYKGGMGGYGQVVMSNGTFVNNNGFINLGSSPRSRGDFQLLGGTVINVNHGAHVPIGYGYSVYTPLNIGFTNGSATGTLLIAGGQWTEYYGWDLGVYSNSYGLVTVSNGILQYAFGNSTTRMMVGAGSDARGEFDVIGGSVLFTNGFATNPWIEVGTVSNTVGRMYVTGGRVSLAANSAGLVVGTNADAKSASVILEGGRVELGQINIGPAGVLSNRTGGLLQFVGIDTVLGSGAKIVDGGTLSYKNYSALTVSVAAAKFNIVSGSGLQLDTATNSNITGTYLLTNAAGSFKDLSLTGNGARWQSDSLLVDSSATLRATNAINARFASTVTNQGTIRADFSTVTWERSMVNSGRYISDPSTNTFMSNVTVTASGTLEGGVGDLFDFKKSLLINSTNNTLFNLASSTVRFSGGGNHTNAVTGGDFGTNGFPVNNFMYGKLSLGSTTDQLYFASGGFSNGSVSNALYVRELDLLGNVNLVTNLHSSFNIYYLLKEHDTFNTYLNDQTYALSGGGFLMPFIPEPSTLVFAAIASVLMVCRKRRSQL